MKTETQNKTTQRNEAKKHIAFLADKLWEKNNKAKLKERAKKKATQRSKKEQEKMDDNLKTFEALPVTRAIINPEFISSKISPCFFEGVKTHAPEDIPLTKSNAYLDLEGEYFSKEGVKVLAETIQAYNTSLDYDTSFFFAMLPIYAWRKKLRLAPKKEEEKLLRQKEDFFNSRTLRLYVILFSEKYTVTNKKDFFILSDKMKTEARKEGAKKSQATKESKLDLKTIVDKERKELETQGITKETGLSFRNKRTQRKATKKVLKERTLKMLRLGTKHEVIETQLNLTLKTIGNYKRDFLKQGLLKV